MQQMLIGICLVLGLMCYYLFSQNETLTMNNMKLESAVVEQQEAMDAMRESYEKQGKALMNMSRANAEIEAEKVREWKEEQEKKAKQAEKREVLAFNDCQHQPQSCNASQTHLLKTFWGQIYRSRYRRNEPRRPNPGRSGAESESDLSELID